MNQAPQLGLIINTWQQADYLSRVLRALSAQRSAPDEVLLADDGSQDHTAEVFKQWAGGQPFATAHVWQEHVGFRRAGILNQAVARARSQYLVFLDGDTVPHPQFVADHRRLARPSAFIQGHRALVGQKAAAWFGLGNLKAERWRALWSLQMQGLKHAFRWPRPLAKARADLRGIRGCNLGIWREHLLRVNGYNEAFVGWGREDSELAVRLMNTGVGRLDVRGWAVCFHLWHPPASRATLPENDELLAQAQRSRATRCEHGLGGHLAS
ncbi:MAG TPA: glycosyltransferase [Verrucomicrobiae bacterium]|nr:glycosyltransferase [Verrucomicrobiae bacterium]